MPEDQGLVAENVAVTADGIGRDRPHQTFLDGRGDGAAHGRDTLVKDGAWSILGVELTTGIKVGAARGKSADGRD